MNKEIKRIKDTIIECPICKNKIKIPLPIFIEEYHGDMYITHEMEYRERKRLEKKITNLEQENKRLGNELQVQIEENTAINEEIKILRRGKGE